MEKTENIEQLGLHELFELTCIQASNKVAAIKDDQWSNDTPCSKWNVTDLLSHMVDELLWVPPLLEGQDMEEAAKRIETETSEKNLISAWEEAAPKAIQAVKRTDLESPVEISSGTVPVRQYLEEMLIDLTIHTWDLSKGIGAGTELDDRLVEAVYELLQTRADQWREEGVFKDAIEVDPESDTQTKLLALAGRAA